MAVSNTLLTPTKIVREAWLQVQNNLTFGNTIHTDLKNEFVKIGDTVTVRMPVKHVVQDGAALASPVPSTVEKSMTVKINKRKHVDWGFSSQDLTLTIEDYSERYIKPAAIALANQMDMDGLILANSINHYVGTAGTLPSSSDAAYSLLSDAGARLDEEGCPNTDRYGALAPRCFWALNNQFKGVYNEPINKQILRDAVLGRMAGFDLFNAQNVYRHTAGAWAGTDIQVVGGSPYADTTSWDGFECSTLTLTGLTNGTTLRVGDTFEIDTVNSVNPITKADTGQRQQFVVMGYTTEAGSWVYTAPGTNYAVGAATTATVICYPRITTTGAYQTVSAAPVATDPIYSTGTTDGALGRGTTFTKNLFYNKNAFARVVVPLEIPQGAPWGGRFTFNNLSIRILKVYDQATDDEIVRMDVMYGHKAVYPELAVVGAS